MSKRKMKDSGVEWLGEIPAEWGVSSLSQQACQVKCKNDNLVEKNLLSLSYGKIKRRDIDAVGGLLPASFEGYNRVESGDIVLRLTDLQNDQHSLRTGLVKERGIVTSAYVSVRPSSRSSSEYLHLALYAFDVVKGFYGMGSGVRQGLTYGDVKQLRLPAPPLSTQRKIAEYLDARCAKIDEMISDAKKTIEEYKAWKASVIFEAVTGKNTGAKMKDSGIDGVDLIPQNWRVCKAIRALSMPITDGPHTTPDLYDTGIPFVSAEAVSYGNGSIDFSHIRGFVSQEFYDECCKKYIPRRDDIYMIKSGATTGRVSIVDTDKVFTIWSPLAVFRANPDLALPRYLFYFLQSSAYQKQVEVSWSYGTQQNIGMRVLEQLHVVLPPIEQQFRIIAELDKKCAAIDRVISEKESLIADLESYKKSLIFECVTGKMEVA